MKKLHHKAKAQKAIAVCYHLRSRHVVVELDSGLELRFSPRDLSGQSLGVSARDLTAVEITPSGSAVFWPRLAIQASISDLLTGQIGVKRWRARRNSFAVRFLKLKGSVPADIDLEF